MEEHIVYLALGSNLGDRSANLKQAIAALTPQLEVKAKTYLEPEQLLKHLKRLEVALGRKESIPNGPRLIDIDILFYDDVVLNTPALVIPHPRLHERGFVLLPLMDIAPDLVHPVSKQSVREMATVSNVEGIEKFV